MIPHKLCPRGYITPGRSQSRVYARVYLPRCNFETTPDMYNLHNVSINTFDSLTMRGHDKKGKSNGEYFNILSFFL